MFFFGKDIDDTLVEPIDMLTKVLIENTDFNLEIAKIVVHKAITITLLNEWIVGFKQRNKEYCDNVNINDKYECMKSILLSNLYSNSIMALQNSSTFISLQKFSLFLFLYDIKPDFNIDFPLLREMQKEFEGIDSKVRAERVAKREEDKKQQVYENFKGALFAYIDTDKSGESFTIDDIDGMDGTQFEHYIAKLFEKMGYVTEITKHSGDQGIDVIAKNDIVTIGIQAKCYSSTVGNSAVQEAVGGRALYKVDKVMVITNNEFTPSAKELAKANSVELWNRSKLKEKISQYRV